ncbi:MAG: TonB-dependent receptor [Salinivirgaceae bacterium]|nr:TonB-dependent receptor [Salinivirgaceae bacterium]
MKRKLLLTVFVLGCLFVGFGQVADSVLDDQFTVELSLEELMNIRITTASKTSQSLSEAPATMVVITDQMIKDRGYHHLEEILHDLPGFDFNKNYGVNYSTIFMRGYRSDNSDRFILMFDGILENDIWKQTTWISRQYPVSQIKQIEVLYGPASALYGTNAFSGIINVISKKGDEVGDVNLVTTAGSYGRKNIEFATGKDVNENISYNVTAKYFSQDDLHQWDEFDAIDGRDANFSQSYLDIRNNAADYEFDKNKMQFMLDGKLTETAFNENLPAENYGLHANVKFGNLTFTALNWTKREMEAYFYNPFKRSGRWTEWFEQNQGYMLLHNKEINDKIKLSSSVSYRVHKILDSKEADFKYYSAPLHDSLQNHPDYPTEAYDYDHTQLIDPTDPTTFQLIPRGVILDNDSSTYVLANLFHYRLQTWDIAFEEQIDYKITDWLDFIGGFKYTFTNTQEDYEYANRFEDIQASPRHIKKNIAGYGQFVVKPMEGLGITMGGRYEDQKDEQLIGYKIFTPRISAVYRLNKSVILRAQYAEAFQDADDWHKYATDGSARPHGSIALEPEKLKAVEFGTTVKVGEKLILSGAYYQNIVSNYIVAVDNTVDNPYYGFTVGEHFENRTDGNIKISGYELSFNTQIMSGISVNGNISGAFNIDADDNEIGDMAPLKVNLGVLYRYKDKITLYPKINYVAAKKTINWQGDETISPIQKQIDGYGIIGLNINVLNTFGFIEGLDWNLKIDNVFNTEYYNPGSRSADGVKYTARVLQPGMNVMAGIKYTFK